MRLATLSAGCALLGLAAAPEAHAGGLGVMALGGLHQENVYVYDGFDVTSPDTTQTLVMQQRPSYGVGLVGLLGDRDDRVLGLMKFYYVGDTAPTSDGVLDAAADNGAVAGADGLIFVLPREEGDVRHLGMASAGVQWGLLPKPDKLQLVVNTSMGAGALTNDSTEFLLAELGAGATYSLNDTLQLSADLNYAMRIRKGFYHNTHATVGFRYMFD